MMDGLPTVRALRKNIELAKNMADSSYADMFEDGTEKMPCLYSVYNGLITLAEVRWLFFIDSSLKGLVKHSLTHSLTHHHSLSSSVA